MSIIRFNRPLARPALARGLRVPQRGLVDDTTRMLSYFAPFIMMLPLTMLVWLVSVISVRTVIAMMRGRICVPE
jgi:hypothetical protein